MSLPTGPNNGNFYGEQPNQGAQYQQNTQPAPASNGKGKKIALITGASVLVVGLLAGGAYAVTNGVNAIGDKDIAQALPGSTAVFGEVDLDPSNGQKLGLVSIAQKVKDLSKEKDIDPNKDPKEMITDGFFKDLDFESEVKPWIGDKVAVAAWGDFTAVTKDYTDLPKMDGFSSDEELLNDYSYGEDTSSDYSTDQYSDPYGEDTSSDYSTEDYSDLDVPVDSEFSADRASATTMVAPKKKTDNIHNVIVYEVKDEKKAKEASEKAFADKDQKFLIQGGYLIIGENQEDIDAYSEAIKSGNLADNASFKDDRKTFNKDAIATGWADLGKFDLGTSAKQYSGKLETKDGKPFTVEGRVITGLSLEQGKASSTTKVIGLKSNAYDVAASTQADGVKDLGNLPGNTFGALAISGLDQSVKDAWEQNKEEIESSKDFASTKKSLEKEYGVSLPEDITKIFGTETVVGLVDPLPNRKSSSSSFDFGGVLRLTGADKDLFEKVLNDAGGSSDIVLSSDDDVTVINYNGDESNGKLGDNDKFKKAVGNTDKSQIAGFADIDRIAELSKEEAKGYGVVGLNGVFDKDKNVTTVTVNWVY
jgi:hypothetical protein